MNQRPAVTDSAAASPPGGYPARYECDVLMSDGNVAHVRPITPSDADALVAFHEGLSRQTVYLRFFGVHPHLRQSEVEHFVFVDYRDRLALVVEIGGSLAAVARYDRAPGTSRAEVAFVVTDDRQGLGLGTLLLEHLAAAARAQGISAFFAETLGDNRPMLEVFQHVGFGCHRSFDGGVVDLSFPIEPTQTYLDAVIARECSAAHSSLQPLIEALPKRPPTGGVGIICQSAPRAAAIASACRSGPVGLSTFVVPGHDTDAEVHRLVAYLALDPATDVIGLELAHLAQPRRFVTVARATSRHKPIVVLVPATARWAGCSRSLLSANAGIWKQSGVEVVDRVEEFIHRIQRVVAQRRSATWVPPDRGPLAEVAGCELRRARAALDGRSGQADSSSALDTAATEELFAAYGVLPGAGEPRLVAAGVWFTVNRDPCTGLSARLGPRDAHPDRYPAFALPLTSVDAQDLVQCAGMAHSVGPEVTDALVRLSRVADDQPEIMGLQAALGVAVAPDTTKVWLGTVRSTEDDPFVRRLVPTHDA